MRCCQQKNLLLAPTSLVFREDVRAETVEQEIIINMHPPTCAEVRTVLKILGVQKAPGKDNIAPDDDDAMSVQTAIDLLQATLRKTWTEEKVSSRMEGGFIYC